MTMTEPDNDGGIASASLAADKIAAGETATGESIGLFELLLLGFTMMSIGIGQSIVFSVLPPITRELGLADSSLALIHTIPAIVWSLTSPFWGRASDKWGRRIVIVIGFMGWGISAALFGFSIQIGLWGLAPLGVVYILMLCTRSLFGVLTSGAPPAANAYVAERTTVEDRTSAMATLGAASGIGNIFGPAVGAGLVIFGLVAPFYFTASVSIIGALLVWRYLPETKVGLDASDSDEDETRAWPNPFESRLLPFFVVGIGSSITNICVLATLAFYYADTLHVDSMTTAGYVAFSLMVEASAALAVQLGFIRIFKPNAAFLMRAGTAVILMANFILLFGTALPHFIAAMFVFGLGFGMMGPGSFAAISLVVRHDELGATTGFLGSATAMAFAAGPVMALPLYQYIHAGPFLLNIAILSGILLLVFMHPTVRRLAKAKGAVQETWH